MKRIEAASTYVPRVHQSLVGSDTVSTFFSNLRRDHPNEMK
jgi:hypothetical protein